MANETKEAPKAKVKNYKILHTQVGPFSRDRVVSADDPLLKDVDFARLIGLEAVKETDEPKTETPLEFSPANPSIPPAPAK